jgi:hypothetical protein
MDLQGLDKDQIIALIRGAIELNPTIVSDVKEQAEAFEQNMLHKAKEEMDDVAKKYGYENCLLLIEALEPNGIMVGSNAPRKVSQSVIARIKFKAPYGLCNKNVQSEQERCYKPAPFGIHGKVRWNLPNWLMDELEELKGQGGRISEGKLDAYLQQPHLEHLPKPK